MFKSSFFVKTLLIGALSLLAASFLVRPSMAVTVQEITTPKGLNYWLVEDETVPLITVSFSFTGGSVLDPADKQGLADVLSATLDEGAGDLDSQAFQARLEETAVRLSFNSGAERFSGVMRTLSANQEVAFDLLGMALSQPRFDEEPIQRMVSRLQARLRGDLTNGDSIAAKTWFATPMARRVREPLTPWAGSMETICARSTAEFLNRTVSNWQWLEILTPRPRANFLTRRLVLCRRETPFRKSRHLHPFAEIHLSFLWTSRKPASEWAETAYWSMTPISSLPMW